MAGPQSIKDHGWRQGSVLLAEPAERVAVPHFADWGPDVRAVLLSQDWDVVHGSYDAEPNVELIRAKVSSAEDAVVRRPVAVMTTPESDPPSAITPSTFFVSAPTLTAIGEALSYDDEPPDQLGM